MPKGACIKIYIYNLNTVSQTIQNYIKNISQTANVKIKVYATQDQNTWPVNETKKTN